MKNRQLIFFAIGIKAVLVSLGISLFYMQSVFGVAKWFDPIANETAIRRSITSSNAPLNEYSPSGFTGLMVAAKNGKYAMAELFLDRGAKVNLKSQAPLNTGEQGNTALLFAINNSDYSDRSQLIKLLLDKGADPDITNAEGEAAIHKIPDISCTNI